jgi:hypothetical protein
MLKYAIDKIIVIKTLISPHVSGITFIMHLSGITFIRHDQNSKILTTGVDCQIHLPNQYINGACRLGHCHKTIFELT